MSFLKTIIPYKNGWFNVIGMRAGQVARTLYTSYDQLQQIFDDPRRTAKYDWYFCPMPLSNKRRTKENALGTSITVLDLDFNGTWTPQTALAALAKTQIPVAAVVFSGNGFHVYIRATRILNPTDRENLIGWLKQESPDLVKDWGCTRDPVHLFRIPGGLNHKYDPPRRTKLMGVYPDRTWDPDDTRFHPNVRPEVSALTLPKASGVGQTNLIASAPLDMELAIDHCPQLKAQEQDPASVGYWAWFGMLTIANVAHNGTSWAHKLSQGHPDYDAASLDRKIASLDAPITCQRFDEYNPGGCDKCPLKGRIRSPAAINQNVVAPVVSPNDEVKLSLPDGYIVRDGGLVFVSEEDTLQISPDLLWFSEYAIQNNRKGRAMDYCRVKAIVHGPHGIKTSHAQAYAADMATSAGRDKLLLRLGVTVSSRKGMIRYLQSCAEHIVKTQKPKQVVEQWGWTEIDGTRALTMPEGFWTVDGLNPTAMADEYLMPLPETNPPAGASLDAYKAAFKLMEDHRYAHLILNVAIGLGAPLMRLLARAGTPIVNFHGSTGCGKTLGLTLQESVWWCPKSHGTIISSNSTVNSIINQVRSLNSLPLCMDELTRMWDDSLECMIYALSQGQPRGRLRPDGTPMNAEDQAMQWQSIFSTASNTFLEDLFAGATMQQRNAMVARCIDIVCKTEVSSDHAAVIAETIAGNYGLLGRTFAQEMLFHPDLAKTVHAAYRYMLAGFNKRAKTPISEGPLRFRAALGAVVIVAFKALEKWGVATKRSYALMMQALMEDFDRAQEQLISTDDDLVSALTGIAQELGDSILVTLKANVFKQYDWEMLGGGRPAQRLRGRLDGDILFLDQVEVWKHLKQKGFRLHESKAELTKLGIFLGHDRIILSAHTDFPGSRIQTRCWRLNWKALTNWGSQFTQTILPAPQAPDNPPQSPASGSSPSESAAPSASVVQLHPPRQSK